MTRTPLRLVIASLAVVSLAALLVFGAPRLLRTFRTGEPPAVGSEQPRKRPPALARHLAHLRQALPGNEGMSENPGSAAEERFLNRAYPDTDIPLARIEAAREAFAAVQAKGIGGDRNAPGEWHLLGPISARYQASPYRTTYDPGEVSVSGRVTALAIAQTCTAGRCRVYVAAAGGGVWRTDNALGGSPKWKFLTGGIGINAVGSIALDEHDPSGATLWIGTGEANASGDSAAGVGIYKSTDAGETWTGPFGATFFNGRSVGSIAIDPRNSNVLYVASTRGVRGVSSTTGGAVTAVPGAAPYGLYKSTDAGATFTFLHNGAPLASTCFPSIAADCSIRGVRRVALDPHNPDVVYAGSYGRGVWRSPDGGATWVQIKPSLNSADNTMRPEIAVNALPDGKTRLYVAEGSVGLPSAPYSRLFRTDDAAGAAAFTDLTSNDPANPGYGSYEYCTGQCWYDNLVVTPPGHPDIVYLGGSYQYGGNAYLSSNGRALVMSNDGGVSWFDMTKDATSRFFPKGLHPDQHALVVHPENPYLFFNGSDGGVMRSSGEFSDESARCGDRGLSGTWLTTCQQLLSKVPAKLISINDGLATLQFYSVSVDPANPNDMIGGTQDNGTFVRGSDTIWRQAMWGDGGQSGFDTALKTFRLHTFFNATPEVNFNNGRITDWHWVADQLYFGGEPQAFYVPIIADPAVSRFMWTGLGHAWRTKTHGMGTMSKTEFSRQCNSFTGRFETFCGDWEPLGATSYAPLAFPNLPSPNSYRSTRLTYGPCPPADCPAPYQYGESKANGTVSRVSRAPGDGSTLWAATSAGRVFISKNADANLASAVAFERLDEAVTGVSVNSAAPLPNRFVSGIAVDPANPNRAWVTYSGYNAATPAAPGHVFEVRYDPAASTVTWTSIDWDLDDLPLNDVALDSVTGDLYVSNDFGVLRLASGGNAWVMAGAGMPLVEVASLTIVPGGRRLYAATHGLGAWWLTLR
ncbi:MAG: exo-alpha-sialidase [Acidobacteria bacterium]|nr:exo-alpha-sialidase [Acidobacteriota bacterium]